MSIRGTLPYTPTCLDLFSGAGGFSLGLELAGFRSVGSVEIDVRAAATFARNHPEARCSFHGPEGDITAISPASIACRLQDEGVPQLDLLVASPPCQGFSMVGRGKLNSLQGQDDAYVSDRRNGLYHHALRILEELRPSAFLLENVVGILRVGGRNSAEDICVALEKAGYVPRCSVLNAAWYGVPQMRERVVIMALRKDLGHEPQFPQITHDAPVNRGHLTSRNSLVGKWKNPEYFVPREALLPDSPLLPAVTVGEALEDLPPFTEHLVSLENGNRYRALRSRFATIPYPHEPRNAYTHLMRFWPGLPPSTGVSDHYCRWTPRDFKTFSLMRPGDCYPEALAIAIRRYKDACEQYRKIGGIPPLREDYVPPYNPHNFPQKWQKLDPELPSCTVTAHLARDTYSHIHPDPRQARTITIREAARLQSFPDSYVFIGNTGDVYRQIGNAVPPLLGAAIGVAIIRKVFPTSFQNISRHDLSQSHVF